MSVRHRVVPNSYRDSVALMAISSKLLDLEGIQAASVVMATPANLDNLATAGLADGLSAQPSDLVVAVRGDDEACDAALALADELLTERPGDGAAPGTSAERAATSIQTALARDPSINMALVSVPGPYAAAEALKALRLGLNVMVFSDNVPGEQELMLKRYATDRGLLVMGPDCGTAIVNGVPLGFANAVRRGPIGVVGASGTGMQEVTSRIHHLGSGVSQALGTGGHDLSEEIGGLSMLTGMAALDADPATEVIVLVSKPPSAAVAARVLARARLAAKPVVAVFLGADPATFTGGMVCGAATLAEAADVAVALATGRSADLPPWLLDDAIRTRLDAEAARCSVDQRFIRGVFCGGTFCYETQLLCRDAGLAASSNTPVSGNRSLADPYVSVEHTIIDMGDDAFTQGRPHPMIDPTLRDERVRREAADPSTAVLLVDVVLGYGASADPAAGLVAILRAARSDAAAVGRHIVVVAHVCGTDADPQDRGAVIDALTGAGAFVASSNAEAARWAAHLVAPNAQA